MNPFKNLHAYARALWRKESLDREMDEEMRLHLEMKTEAYLRQGMSLTEARRAARREFGWMDTIKETCRDQRGVTPVEHLVQDVRFGLRVLRKSPGFTLVAVVTLALGIAATCAVFDLIEGVLLTPPPFHNPGRIVVISLMKTAERTLVGGCTTGQWIEWQNEAKAFDAVAGWNGVGFYLMLPDGNEFLNGMEVTSDYFKIMGTKPLLGRLPSEKESPTTTAAHSVILLGYDVWQRRFNGDRNILGKTVRLGSIGQPLTVIGVMPPGVRFLPPRVDSAYDGALVDFWLPISPDIAQPNARFWWCVAARLREDATLKQAQTELTTINARQAKADPQFHGITAKAERLTVVLNREGRRLLLPLLGAVTLVFLIACGNVAGLLLAHGLQRQKEYSIRCALGAGRTRLLCQLLTETSLLALLGGALGACLTVGTVKLFIVIGGSAIPRLGSVTIGWPVLAFCFGMAMVATGLTGLVPAFRALELNPMAGLKGTRSTAGRAERRLLHGVAIFQTGLTLALLMGAGLLIRTTKNLANVRPGYLTQNILTMEVTLTEGPDYMTEFAKWSDLHELALQRVATLPGVQKAAFGVGVPLTGQKWDISSFEIEGEAPAAAGIVDKRSVPARVVSPDYFATLGLVIRDGRSFRLSDREDSPLVAIINEALAELYFPNANPIAKKLRFAGWPNPAEIVGVVANARTKTLADKPEPELYLPIWQFHGARSKQLLIRTMGDSRRLLPAVEKELKAVDPSFVITNVRTLEQIRSESVATQTFAMRLLVGFSIVAFVLALVGIYGVLSLSVNSRTQEIAIRAAVGAQRQDILGLIFRYGFWLIASGVILGTASALGLAQILRTFLFGVQPTDPATFVEVVLLFVGVALMACWLPARRASRIDPLVALRAE